MNHKIKVAHVLHSVGGVEVSLRLILENINPKEFENIIIHGTDDVKTGFQDKTERKLTDYSISIFRNISFVKDIKAVIKAYAILKKEKPDLIHAHSAKGGVIGRIVGWLLKVNVLYTPQAFSYLSASGKLKKSLFLKIEQLTRFSNSYVLASSNSERDRALNEVKYPGDKVLLFNNSIKPIHDISSLSIEKTWPDNYICSVGRPSYQKNIELMIEVFDKVRKEKDIHLLVIGLGFHHDRLDSVLNLIKKYNLENHVTLLKWTERGDIFNIIKHAKLYISTARYEGLPYSIIESLALGKPCVVTDCDGNRDLVTNNVNGYVIKNENVEEFKDKLLHILNNKAVEENFGKNSLKIFGELFNMDNNIEKLEAIYRKYSSTHM